MRRIGRGLTRSRCHWSGLFICKGGCSFSGIGLNSEGIYWRRLDFGCKNNLWDSLFSKLEVTRVISKGFPFLFDPKLFSKEAVTQFSSFFPHFADSSIHLVLAHNYCKYFHIAQGHSALQFSQANHNNRQPHSNFTRYCHNKFVLQVEHFPLLIHSLLHRITLGLICI